MVRQISRTIYFLCTNKKILVYSYNGQISAFIVAYLRILGYEAYSLKYGASQFSLERLLWSEETRDFIFDVTDVKNYQYQKG